MSTDTDTAAADRRMSRQRWLYLVYLLFYPFPWLFKAPSTRDVIAALLALPVFLWFYFAGTRYKDRRVLPYALGLFLLGLVLQPFHGVWSNVSIYGFAISAYCGDRRLSIIAILSFNAVLAAFGLLLHLPFVEWGVAMFFGTTVAFSSLAFAALQEKNRELEATRESARRMAILAERERISRDLHDLLGHTLTTVAIKADLARRLIDRDPEQARREIEDIHKTARAALADVRGAVTGMRSTTLAVEVAEVRRSLASAGIAFDYDGPSRPLRPEVETAFAFVLREAVTNVARHAAAEHCRVRISVEESGAAELLVHDDGRGGPFGEGNGLRGLRERVTAVGGTLTIESLAGTALRARVQAGAAP